jgi:antitoxin ParD1/3/4
LVTLKKIEIEMGKNTSISLGNHFENFIENSITKGRYTNASEVVRAGLRLLEEEEEKVVALRRAIQEGIDSGIAENFDSKIFLQELKSRKKANG